jgi:hypothetical protein
MDWQLLTGISSAVIALCALAVSIWHVRQGIKYNKLAVKPNITSWTETNPDGGYYCIWLTNNGLGPAIVERFVVKVDEHDMLTDFTERTHMPGAAHEPIENAIAALFPGDEYNLHSSFMAKGYAMPSKDRCKVIEIQFIGEVLPRRESVMASFSRGEIIVDYKSIYGDETFHYSLRQHQF